MKNTITRIPFINAALNKLYQVWLTLPYVFSGSKIYWIERYQCGGRSGTGSYNQLAEFKAEILNRFVSKHNVDSIIEYGCGDGNQLKLYDIPHYLGFDISPEAISICRDLFSDDGTKSFKMMKEYSNETADLTLSIDVIYHLIEDQVYHNYMHRLFDSAQKHVIIYSSNTNSNSIFNGAHIKHRKFTAWVDRHKPEWTLIKHIPNRYPLRHHQKKNGSLSDFYIYEKKSK